MPQYFSPGVYVEEVDSGPRPIQGVSTSVTGAVGVTLRGSLEGKPVLVTSFNEFTRKFGGFLKEPTQVEKQKLGQEGQWWLFPQAVKAFFDNGGQQLYVKRVAATTDADVTKRARSANLSIGKGFISELVRDAQAGAETLSIHHLMGIDATNLNGVEVFSSPTVKVDDFTVESYAQQGSAGIVKLNKGLSKKLSVAEGARIVVESGAIEDPVVSPLFSLKASSPGSWGNDIRVTVRPMVGDSLKVLPLATETSFAAVTSAAAVFAANTLTLEFADPHSQVAVGDILEVRGSKLKVTNIAADPKKIQVESSVAIDIPSGSSVRKLRKAESPGTKLGVSGASRLYANAIVEIERGQSKEVAVVAGITGNEVTLSAALSTQYVEDDVVRIIEVEIVVEYAPGGTVVEQEAFRFLRLMDNTDQNDSLFIKTALNAAQSGSKLVQVDAYTLTSVTGIDNFPYAISRYLQSGADSFANLSVDDFIGADGGSNKRTGIQSLEDIDDVSIVMVPGMWSDAITADLIRHCEFMRYRVAILDAPYLADLDSVQAHRAKFDSSHAALYHPWITIRDPSRGGNADIPPSGSLAGIWADVDARRGVHKAPANEVIKSTVSLTQDITRREQDLLNPKGINALRFFPGRGNRVWGARTISSDTNFRYINVRRIFNFIERSIDEGTQFVVFEPNDPQLWSRVRQTINNFLNTQWRAGMLEGRTAEEAYFVACDRGATMNQDDIENGRLICQVGIAPVYPAEFVIFRIQKYTADSKLA